MLTHSPEAGAAIEAEERYFAQRLMVDWNNNGAYDHPLSDLSAYIVETSRDQSLSGTAPDELQLIEGNAAAKLAVDLSGAYDGTSLAAHFAPYNGLSIFYTVGITLGVDMFYEVEIATATGTETFRQFTGVVRTVDTDRETGFVSLDCLDNAEKLRSGVDIPPYALFKGYLQDGYKRGMLVDSSSLIDLAARSAGFTMGPPQPWTTYQGQLRADDANGVQSYGPVLSVPFHGSVLPEVGTLDGDCSFHLTEDWEDNAFKYRSEAYCPGPHGYLALNAVPPERHGYGYKKFWLHEWGKQGGSLRNRTWVMGAWVYWTGREVDGDSTVVELRNRENYIQIVLESLNGGIAARIVEHTGYVATSSYEFMSPGWNYVEARFVVFDNGSYTMQVRVNDKFSPEAGFPNSRLTDTGDVLSGLAKIENHYPISDVYITNFQGLSWFGHFGYTITPADTARVSWGRNRVTYTLREQGLEGWQLAKDVSSAEFGVVLFDEDGRFVSWNYDDITSRQASPVRTFTIDDLQSLAFRNTFDSVRNVWTVTTRTGWAENGILYDLGEDGVPFRRDARSGELVPDVFNIPAGTSKEWFVSIDDHAISVYPFGIPSIPARDPQTNVILDAPGYWDRFVPKHGKMAYTADNFRHDMSDLSEQKFINRNIFRLWIWNGYGEPVGFLGPNGEPRFRVQGLTVVEQPEQTWSIRDEDSIDTYGERVFELPQSFWLQDEYQTRAMLTSIVARMARPIPVSESITVPGDPRVQLGDMVQLRDEAGFGERMWVQILGIKRTFSSDEGLRDTYTIEQIAAAGVGLWDSTTYGLWDQSFIWS